MTETTVMEKLEVALVGTKWGLEQYLVESLEKDPWKFLVRAVKEGLAGIGSLTGNMPMSWRWLSGEAFLIPWRASNERPIPPQRSLIGMTEGPLRIGRLTGF